jgi:uncharacterized protein YndB with AHSA1/START domain/DNA-binding transcriptional ArsR family regulator
MADRRASELLTALAEPSRLRIVELLHERPHTVGEVAQALDIRQPQVTKHLQTLSRAGLVTVHPLGQRRVCALERTALRELRDWLDGLAQDEPAHAVLEHYRRAVEHETAAAAADPHWAEGRTLHLARTLPAPPATVWEHLTTPARMGWWAPDHFTVADAALEPRPGGAARLVLAEGAGETHTATGTVSAATAPHAIDFVMSPLAPDGTPLFTVAYAVRLTPHGDGTDLTVDMRVDASTEAAAPAVAGMRTGWEQSLDRLHAALA